ncbi:orotidine 5'-phosphate decarboxylase [Ignisphaera aggregans DSM 17230]|uniref:Orotidine 5'-phosphate decarboxylase n=1 Tax=Ignisphaera aggregans (strain DSM 17230 / JCM 13409 / AQ1.S1) TaxID=583356 RepID=E0SQE5_IGNAA|nr:orotidine 5'-phosphate decarboxylase [Ignisphaera aggregans DSM 17230]
MTIIVALDPPLFVDPYEWIYTRYIQLRDVVEGFKVGLPAIIRLGVEKISTIFRDYNKFLIADLKLADIGDIMSLSIEILATYGFNAVIAHGFVGIEQALDIASKHCKDLGIKLILVVSMSHDGSREFIDKHLDELIDIAKKIESWGVVAPATRPEIIKRIRMRYSSTELKILSPGVGVQGAEPGIALCNGADYEIIGRAITLSSNIRESALRIKEEQSYRVRQCLGSL